MPRLARIILMVCLVSQALPAGLREDRKAAIDHALSFVYATASNYQTFADHGSDMLWCLYTISHTSRDRHLAAQAQLMGRDVAERWRRLHQHVPPDATAIDIYKMVMGSYAADQLGFPDPRFKEEVRQAVPRFNAKDYLGFDAAHEPPSPDDPGRYGKFSDALIRSFFGDAYGITLGAHYREVLQWLPRMRPYEGHDEDTEFDIFYAVTHVIYTVDGYHDQSVALSLLPQEFKFLRRKLDEAIDDKDPEMVGEALDCLKAAGLENDPQVKKGMRYLVGSQRPDGAWAGDKGDIYTAYHSAWTGIDGLRDYQYHGQVTTLP